MTGYIGEIGGNFEVDIDLLEEVQNFLSRNEQERLGVIQQSLNVVSK